MTFSDQASSSVRLRHDLTVPRVLLWGCVAGAVGAALRYGLIELSFFRASCEADVLPLWCWPRRILTYLFDFWLFGAVSAVCAAYGVVKPESPRAAAMAVIFGAVGLALYNAGPASVGLVFGLATLARQRW